MDLNKYQNMQQSVLYQNGTIDKSHDMFLDLDDMYLFCLKCKEPESSYKPNLKLREVCRGKK